MRDLDGIHRRMRSAFTATLNPGALTDNGDRRGAGARMNRILLVRPVDPLEIEGDTSYRIVNQNPPSALAPHTPLCIPIESAGVGIVHVGAIGQGLHGAAQFGCRERS